MQLQHLNDAEASAQKQAELTQTKIDVEIAGASRELSAGLLGGIGDLLGIAEAGEAIAMFDRMSEDEVRAARSWLVTTPSYRAALERLGDRRG